MSFWTKTSRVAIVSSVVLLSCPSARAQDGTNPPGPTPAGDDLKSAQKAAIDAKTDAARANAEKDAATKKEQEAKDALNDLKSGKLIKYGVTAGFAVALQTQLSAGRAAQTAPAFTTMPYLLLVPGYWFTSEANSLYCATHWGGGDDGAATAAAQSSAKRVAERKYKAILAELAASIADDRIVENFSLDNIDGAKHLGLIKKAVASQKADDKDVAIEALSSEIWNPAYAGKCLITKFGAWVGIPVNYSAATRLIELDGSNVELQRSITNKAAFGVSFTPNAYFSFLIGATVGTIAQKNIPATVTTAQVDGVERTVWSATIAVGGNLDLIGLLVKR